MEWWQALFIALPLLAVLLAHGVWVPVCLGLTGMVILIADGRTTSLQSLGAILWTQAGNFVLLAIPLFILMGEIIVGSDLSRRFYRSVEPWMRLLPGGLFNSNVVASTLFAAVSGSSVATAASISTVAIPELRRRGYSERLMFGTLAAGGTLGILIPPSTAMIIYGSMVNESVARLFMAGLLPGLGLMALFVGFVTVSCLIRPSLAPVEAAPLTAREMFHSVRGTIPLASLIVLVIGSIYSGIVTPTEAAALGVVGALLIAALAGQLKLANLAGALVRSVVATSMLLFIILGAGILSYAFARVGVTRSLVEWVTALHAGPWTIFALICLLYLLLGCFMDAISIMVLTLPLVHPVIVGLGFDPIWFGVILVILIEIGLITPPVGLNLFVIQSFAGRKQAFTDIVAGSFPFVVLMLVGVLILCMWPEIALWLPRQL